MAISLSGACVSEGHEHQVVPSDPASFVAATAIVRDSAPVAVMSLRTMPARHVAAGNSGITLSGPDRFARTEALPYPYVF